MIPHGFDIVGSHLNWAKRRATVFSFFRPKWINFSFRIGFIATLSRKLESVHQEIIELTQVMKIVDSQTAAKFSKRVDDTLELALTINKTLSECNYFESSDIENKSEVLVSDAYTLYFIVLDKCEIEQNPELKSADQRLMDIAQSYSLANLQNA